MTDMTWTLSYFADYAQIALENHTTIAQLLAKRKAIDEKLDSSGKLSEEDDREWSDISREMNKHSRIVIVFCALSLEAFINDYAIEHLSKSYLEKYLDKLGLYAKWVVIPRLLTGSQLPTGAKPMQDLDWLIKERNRLVHFKTENLALSELGDRLDSYNEETAERAILTVRNMALALHSIDRRAHETWLCYEGKGFPSKRLDSR